MGLIRGFLTAFLVTGAVAIAPAAASAEVLYGADGAGAGGTNTTSNLYILDPATGAVVRTVGPIGYAVTGLAEDPTNGALYGSTGTRSVAPGSLIRIDPNTGAGTLIGDLFPDNDNNDPAADIAFRADGTLYGWIEDPDVPADDLARIDKSTGAATIVADSQLGTEGSGLAFSPAGTLFLAPDGDHGALYTIDPATGMGTVGATLNGPSGNDINALSFNAAGALYGSVLSSSGVRPTTLDRIDPATGDVTVIGPSVNKLDAIEFYSPNNLFTTKLKGRTLKVTVNSAGTVVVGDAGGKAKGAVSAKKRKSLRKSKKSGGPGVIKLKLRLTKPTNGILQARGKLKLKARVTFTPNGGTSNSKVLKLKLKSRRK
jgi:uncharacterized protein DUF6923